MYGAISGLLGGSGALLNLDGFNYDNTVYVGPSFSTGGLLFSVAGDVLGQAWNLWGTGGTNGAVATFVLGHGYPVMAKGTLNISEVPEPASIALLGLGLLGFAAACRRKQ